MSSNDSIAKNYKLTNLFVSTKYFKRASECCNALIELTKISICFRFEFVKNFNIFFTLNKQKIINIHTIITFELLHLIRRT